MVSEVYFVVSADMAILFAFDYMCDAAAYGYTKVDSKICLPSFTEDICKTDTGLGDHGALISSGDIRSPLFVQGKPAGVASYSFCLPSPQSFPTLTAQRMPPLVNSPPGSAFRITRSGWSNLARRAVGRVHQAVRGQENRRRRQ
jgi:hypothetical protein